MDREIIVVYYCCGYCKQSSRSGLASVSQQYRGNRRKGGADKILDINHDQEVVRVFTGRSDQGN